MNYVWGTGTDTGKVRTGNEDSLYPTTSGRSSGPAVLMVADGMGGAVAGEVASRLAVEAASEPEAGDPIDPSARVLAGNDAVLEASLQDPSLSGMGTTMTLVELHPNGMANFAHVGDSRAYLLRDEALELLTTDHTLVNSLLELGKITKDEAEHHPHRHLLTRVLGLGQVDVDAFSLQLREGDRILLCSDGLTTMVTDFTIEQILKAGEGVEPTSWALIEQANMAGGVDNTTVVVIDVIA
ncbi:Protein serine/threonine phosphatase PrpC, regulation of stationary phase [hydrothermal vent metagenome]|uniref:Protein serine/threonine phosphatase PrpC, regulation of stationary phase n=1 Tax=hydrothermal vent metagenome TaxID=652676 RepID=A0A3B0SYX0_9ZZZZ